MSEALSPATGRPYGIERICRSYDLPRSSFYLQRQRALCDPPHAPRKRGPKTPHSDADLLAVIQAELAQASAKRGYRRIWEQLRLQHGIQVSRKRVFRILREHQLLVPRRKARPSCGQTGITSSDTDHNEESYPC